MNLNEQIEQMRMEQPRSEAKGELILKLQKHGIEKKPMKLITKISIPTAITAIAIVGGTFMFRPTVLASTSSVANALKQALSYRIKSYNVSGNQRTLMTETTVADGKKATRSFDINGKIVDGPAEIDLVGAGGIEAAFGLKLDASGSIKHLTKDDLEKVKFKVSLKPKNASGSMIVVTKDGQQVQLDGAAQGGHQIKVDGVAKGGKIKLDGLPLKGNHSVEVKVTKDSSGKIIKKYFVGGKEVDKLPEGLEAKMKQIEGMHGKADGIKVEGHQLNIVQGEALKVGGSNLSMKEVGGKQHAVIGTSGKDGKMTTFVSGQTSADYLIKLLQDSEKWTITRNVTFNGQNLDKFVLKGPFSPIELYVDPTTSLPKVLRFTPPVAEGVTIEDVYEYNVQPTR